jgi:hypothetical protein
VDHPVEEPPADVRAIPRTEYRLRREARLALGKRQARWEQVVGQSRVVVFLVGLTVAGLSFYWHLLSPWWLALPVALFLSLLVWHQQINRICRRTARAAVYYEAGLERLDDRWSGKGHPGTRYLDEQHPNAVDLDLFGKGSLFELLCTARTRCGEDTLATWLRTPAAPEEICARQGAVAELRDRLDLREDLALLGGAVPAGVDLDGLSAWGTAQPILTSRVARITAFVLAVSTLLSLVGWYYDITDRWLFLALFLAEILFALVFRGRVREVLAPVEQRSRDLAVLSSVLARIEREPFQDPLLVRLQNALQVHGKPPSVRIAELALLLDWLYSKRNQFFALFALLTLWDTQFAFAIEAWRKSCGPAIPRWLEAVGDFEALCALAAYAYENPPDPFPEIVTDGPCFNGDALGHPLIPLVQCVRNDMHLGGELRLLVVSGSNMSGKSTLLRTVGINAVLALAGAPVRAKRLRLSPLVVGGTLRIQDSLQAGRSRFFAEITRVGQLVALARGPLPLLFLFDEVFQGTNSHDRRVGAEAVVRRLVEMGALGLVTTHDLALTHIADRLGTRAANVHFEDHFEDGKMTFDYRMRPGVVQKSNALALMRAVGLEV